MVFEKLHDEHNGKHCHQCYTCTTEFVREHFPLEIKQKVYDSDETQELVDEFADIVRTDFNIEGLKEIFKAKPRTIEQWRIGEAFAEYFLECEFQVRFWYNHMRDMRNQNSSDAGTDLIGFVSIDDETQFAFGEVKTSEDKASPPRAVTSRTGLKQQIETLATDDKVKDELVRYLGTKVRTLDEANAFRKDFRAALMVFARNKSKVHLFGLLVRDTEFKTSDLKSRFDLLKETVPAITTMKMVSIYVPIKMSEWAALVGEAA